MHQIPPVNSFNHGTTMSLSAGTSCVRLRYAHNSVVLLRNVTLQTGFFLADEMINSGHGAGARVQPELDPLSPQLDELGGWDWEEGGGAIRSRRQMCKYKSMCAHFVEK